MNNIKFFPKTEFKIKHLVQKKKKDIFNSPKPFSVANIRVGTSSLKLNMLANKPITKTEHEFSKHFKRNYFESTMATKIRTCNHVRQKFSEKKLNNADPYILFSLLVSRFFFPCLTADTEIPDKLAPTTQNHGNIADAQN